MTRTRHVASVLWPRRWRGSVRGGVFPRAAPHPQARTRTPSHWQDAFNISEPSGQHNVKNGGQRLGTLLVYLNDVNEGGCTYFVHLGIRIRSAQRLTLLLSELASPNALEVHAGGSGGGAVADGKRCACTQKGGQTDHQGSIRCRTGDTVFCA